MNLISTLLLAVFALVTGLLTWRVWFLVRSPRAELATIREEFACTDIEPPLLISASTIRARMIRAGTLLSVNTVGGYFVSVFQATAEYDMAMILFGLLALEAICVFGSYHYNQSVYQTDLFWARRTLERQRRLRYRSIRD